VEEFKAKIDALVVQMISDLDDRKIGAGMTKGYNEVKAEIDAKIDVLREFNARMQEIYGRCKK
jgi:hypothetical protein